MELPLYPLNKLPDFQVVEGVQKDVFFDDIGGKELAHLLQNRSHRMLAIGETTEKCCGVIEAEALIQLFGVQHRAPVPQRLQAYARPQGERGAGAGVSVPDGLAFIGSQGSVPLSLQWVGSHFAGGEASDARPRNYMAAPQTGQDNRRWVWTTTR